MSVLLAAVITAAVIAPLPCAAEPQAIDVQVIIEAHVCSLPSPVVEMRHVASEGRAFDDVVVIRGRIPSAWDGTVALSCPDGAERTFAPRNLSFRLLLRRNIFNNVVFVDGWDLRVLRTAELVIVENTFQHSSRLADALPLPPGEAEFDPSRHTALQNPDTSENRGTCPQLYIAGLRMRGPTQTVVVTGNKFNLNATGAGANAPSSGHAIMWALSGPPSELHNGATVLISNNSMSILFVRDGAHAVALGGGALGMSAAAQLRITGNSYVVTKVEGMGYTSSLLNCNDLTWSTRNDSVSVRVEANTLNQTGSNGRLVGMRFIGRVRLGSGRIIVKRNTFASQSNGHVVEAIGASVLSITDLQAPPLIAVADNVFIAASFAVFSLESRIIEQLGSRLIHRCNVEHHQQRVSTAGVSGRFVDCHDCVDAVDCGFLVSSSNALSSAASDGLLTRCACNCGPVEGTDAAEWAPFVISPHCSVGVPAAEPLVGGGDEGGDESSGPLEPEATGAPGDAGTPPTTAPLTPSVSEQQGQFADMEDRLDDGRFRVLVHMTFATDDLDALFQRRVELRRDIASAVGSNRSGDVELLALFPGSAIGRMGITSQLRASGVRQALGSAGTLQTNYAVVPGSTVIVPNCERACSALGTATAEPSRDGALCICTCRNAFAGPRCDICPEQFAGDQCDECAAGLSGRFPNCVTCATPLSPRYAHSVNVSIVCVKAIGAATMEAIAAKCEAERCTCLGGLPSFGTMTTGGAWHRPHCNMLFRRSAANGRSTCAEFLCEGAFRECAFEAQQAAFVNATDNACWRELAMSQVNAVHRRRWCQRDTCDDVVDGVCSAALLKAACEAGSAASMEFNGAAPPLLGLDLVLKFFVPALVVVLLVFA